MTEKSGFSIWGAKKNLNPSNQTQQNTQQSYNTFSNPSSNRPNYTFNRSDQNVNSSSPSFLQNNPNNKKIYNNNSIQKLFDDILFENYFKNLIYMKKCMFV